MDQQISIETGQTIRKDSEECLENIGLVNLSITNILIFVYSQFEINAKLCRIYLRTKFFNLIIQF